MYVDSDVHRSDIATHSLLGGQYGEESEESEEGEEEGQEEEVTLPRNNGAIDRDVDAASQRPTRPKPNQRNAAAVATSALVDDGGRRRNGGSSFTDTVFWSGFSRAGSSPGVLGSSQGEQVAEDGKQPTISVSRRCPRSLDKLLSARAARRGFCFAG
jgi:hypothetical protein